MNLHIDAQSWQTLSLLLGQTAAVLTAIAVIWRFIGKPLRDGFRRVTEILSFVESELRTNGGSTLRDQGNRIESGLKTANRTLGLVAQRQLVMHNLDETGIWETNAQGLCTYVNPAMSRIAGAMMAEFMGLGWKTVIHPDDREELSASWASAVADKRDFEFVYRFVNNVPVRISGKRMFGQTGEVLGWIGDCHRQGQNGVRQ